MPQLNIVLVEPEIPQNTGNISRTCAATGARLHLVEPMGFTIDDKKLKRAGLDYWPLLDVTYYKNLDDFFARNAGPFFYFSTKASHIYSDVAYPDGAYLVFGKETKGLPESLLHDNPNSCVRLPMIDNDAARSLNLSNSVAVGVYEALRQWGFPGLRTEGHLTPNIKNRRAAALRFFPYFSRTNPIFFLALSSVRVAICAARSAPCFIRTSSCALSFISSANRS